MARDQEREADVLGHRSPWQQFEVLEDDADTSAKPGNCGPGHPDDVLSVDPDPAGGRQLLANEKADHGRHIIRSEEHTSELQSLAYLVCRLLLEKKKETTARYVRRGFVQ